MVISTLNRTPKAFLLGIVGAEYVLGWLPRGTHDWRKFVRPEELAAALRRNGLEMADLTGVTYSPVSDRWRLSHDASVNYMAFATKPKGRGSRRSARRPGQGEPPRRRTGKNKKASGKSGR